jgi:hypothetical protein
MVLVVKQPFKSFPITVYWVVAEGVTNLGPGPESAPGFQVYE